VSEALTAVMNKFDSQVAAKEKERAAAGRTYRELCAQIAANETPTAKQQEQLLGAMKLLELTPADLSNDVATIVQVVAIDHELAQTTEEALVEAQLEAKRRYEEAEQEVKRLRMVWHNAQGPISNYSQRSRYREELVKKSPRLFPAT
jgi:hypothetical protein